VRKKKWEKVEKVEKYETFIIVLFFYRILKASLYKVIRLHNNNEAKINHTIIIREGWCD